MRPGSSVVAEVREQSDNTVGQLIRQVPHVRKRLNVIRLDNSHAAKEEGGRFAAIVTHDLSRKARIKR